MYHTETPLSLPLLPPSPVVITHPVYASTAFLENRIYTVLIVFSTPPRIISLQTKRFTQQPPLLASPTSSLGSPLSRGLSSTGRHLYQHKPLQMAASTCHSNAVGTITAVIARSQDEDPAPPPNPPPSPVRRIDLFGDGDNESLW